MNAKVCLVLGLVALGMVALGGFALAAEYVWDGDGPVSGGTWIDQGDWVLNSGYPDDTNDNVFLEDVSPSPTCTYSPSGALSVKNMTITGSSPTKMKLHVSGAALTVDTFELNDYAELDIDQDFTVNPGTGSARTTLSGEIWIDVASTKTFSAADTRVEGTNTILNLTTSGTVEMEDLVLDADTDNAQRSLKVVGGTITMHDPFAMLKLTSDDDADNHRAKLWVASTGSFDWECDGDILITGGDSAAQRVELDIDNNFADFSAGQDFYVLPVITGYVDIDVAAGKKITLPHLSLGGPCVLKVTGSGTLESTTNTCEVGCGSCP